MLDRNLDCGECQLDVFLFKQGTVLHKLMVFTNVFHQVHPWRLGVPVDVYQSTSMRMITVQSECEGVVVWGFTDTGKSVQNFGI